LKERRSDAVGAPFCLMSAAEKDEEKKFNAEVTEFADDTE